MARISTYTKDTTVQKTDKLLGSNIGGATKNFAIENISAFLANTNAGANATQLVYVFHDHTFGGDGGRKAGSLTISGNTSQEVALSGVTSIKISKSGFGQEDDFSSIIDILANKTIMLRGVKDQSSFGIYTVSSVTQDSQETDFYDLSLTSSASNGSLEESEYYALSFSVGGSGGTTHHSNVDESVSHDSVIYTHRQDDAAATWTVTHNLGRHPSVTVILPTGQRGIADVTYTNTNELTITHAGSESGRAELI